MRITSVEHPYLDRFSKSFILHTSVGAVLIDTGLASGCAKIVALAPKPSAILCTHGHWDHMGGHSYFRKKGAAIYAHQGDAHILGDLKLQWELLYEQFREDFSIPPARRTVYGQSAGEAVPVDVYLEDGQELTFGDCKIQVIVTPGHSSGSVCYYLPDEGVLFTGDTVCGAGFFGGLPQLNDPVAYVASLKRLKRVEAERVYSAHSPAPMGRAAYGEALSMGLDCIARLGQLIKDFIEAHPQGFVLGQVAEHLAEKEGKSGGSGACITALAYLKAFSGRYPAAKDCCMGYCL